MRMISTKTPHDGTWTGHFGPITSVEWSPDGALIATGSYDGQVVVWEASGLTPIAYLAHTRLVNGVRWSRDGHLLAVACADGHTHIWNTTTMEKVGVLSRHTDDVNTIAWSPDGESLVSVSEDGTGRLWDVSASELIADSILVHSNHCMSVDFHPDGNLIATCGEDSTIRIWNRTPHSGSTEVWPQPGDLESVRWSPDGKLLAAACDDSTVRVLNRQGANVATLGPHGGAVKSVAWSPDSKSLASGAYDLSVSVWDIQTSELQGRICDHGIWPRGLHWSPGGSEIVVGSQSGIPTVLGVSHNRQETILTIRTSSKPNTCGINSVRTVDRKCYVGADDGTIRVWDLGSDNLATIEPKHSAGRSLINAIDVATAGHICYGTFAGDVGVLSAEGISSVVGLGAPINSVRWGSESLIAAVDYTGRVTVFCFENNALRKKHDFLPSDAAAKSIAWLGNDHLVTGSTDRLVRIIDLQGTVRAELKGHGNLINAVDVSRGTASPLIASASRDRTVRIWEPESGNCLSVLIGHTASVKSVAWRAGSTTELASGSYDFDVRIWNTDRRLSDPAYSRVLEFHTQGVSALDWSTHSLVSASWDGAVAKWRVDEFEPGLSATKALPPLATGSIQTKDD